MKKDVLQKQQNIENSESISCSLNLMSPKANKITIPIQKFYITSRSDTTGVPFSDGFYVIEDFNFTALEDGSCRMQCASKMCFTGYNLLKSMIESRWNKETTEYCDKLLFWVSKITNSKIVIKNKNIQNQKKRKEKEDTISHASNFIISKIMEIPVELLFAMIFLLFAVLLPWVFSKKETEDGVLNQNVFLMELQKQTKLLKEILDKLKDN